MLLDAGISITRRPAPTRAVTGPAPARLNDGQGAAGDVFGDGGGLRRRGQA